MSKYIYFTSTQWGGDTGGINLFNKSLVEALARISGEALKVSSVVSDKGFTSPTKFNDISFLHYEGNSRSLSETIKKDINVSDGKSEIYIIGHDVHTGDHAIEARDILKKEGINAKSAHFCHMDYSKYDFLKDNQHDYLTKAKEQRRLIKQADKVFAVGPLLRKSFAQYREEIQADSIIEVVPGFPERLETSKTAQPMDLLKFFFSGRIGKDIDQLKNSRPILTSILDNYVELKDSSKDSLWNRPGRFEVFGFPNAREFEEWYFEGHDKSNIKKYLNVFLNDFTNQDKMLEYLCESHIAIMPSAHEGFGLSGWEAICAGIPAIIPEHSGLADLLNHCFEENHSLQRESVRIINGQNLKEDYSALKFAIRELATDYKRVKTHAVLLANYLREKYKWEDCASKVASSLNFLPEGDGNWERRRDYSKYSSNKEPWERIQNVIKKTEDGSAFEEWKSVCTALNYINDLSGEKKYSALNQTAKELSKLTSNIALAYDQLEESNNPPRCSGRLDIAWRFMAASSSTHDTFSKFIDSIPEKLKSEIIRDNFLLREFLYYAMNYSPDFKENALEISTDIFSKMKEIFQSDICFQYRIARLEICNIGFEYLSVLGENLHDSYLEERARCKKIRSNDFEFSDLLEGNNLHLLTTFLALSSYDEDIRKNGIERIFEHCDVHGMKRPELTWRSDKLLWSSIISAILTPSKIMDLLIILSEDEDESIRWAAIDLAFSVPLRKRLFLASKSRLLKLTQNQIKFKLGQVVDNAIKAFGFHPWMQREFLNRFWKEHKNANIAASDKFTLNDFPIGRQLIGKKIEQEKTLPAFEKLHPEVDFELKRLCENTRRILLVLPPLKCGEKDEENTARTSTPALGLGLLGSQLLAAGHDVQLADCHRFPDLTEMVINNSSDFHFVGFNSVITTSRSVIEMATKIKSGTNAPKIVIGGPASNSGAFTNAAISKSETKCWDYEIVSNAADNFLNIINPTFHMLKSVPEGIVPNSESDLVLTSLNEPPIDRCRPAPNEKWHTSFILDRRIYSTMSGDYEPQPTRAINLNFVEAHIVMSRGCDWNCTFCTERREISKGEVRRTVDQVCLEIEELVMNSKDLRIQFVDDNMFPQICKSLNKKKSQIAENVEWTQELLEFLTAKYSEKIGSFGWRGIMRVEDFFQYELEIENFVELLKSSGCSMLAFGIEHGNEVHRKKMKVGPSATNEQFKALFLRLRDVGIHSKAYFILGGPKETEISSEETIRFAIESGSSLAYFALYKEFVPATKILSSEISKESLAHKKYSNYEAMKIDWDDILSKGMRNREDLDFTKFLKIISDDDPEFDVKSTAQIYDELSRLGFRFADLVKYSDHHANNDESRELLNKLNLGDQNLFENKILSAYARFYLRREFISTYSSLLNVGY